MGLGYDRPLHILALDHRVPPHHSVFGVSDPPSPDEVTRIIGAKAVIVDGFAAAIAAARGAGDPIEGAGVLVDEELAAAAARRAQTDGWIFAMPTERSGLPFFELEHGDDFAAHIEAFDPNFVKILVRYNPNGSTSDNERSRAGLTRLQRWLRVTDRKLLFELIVPATPAQLDGVAGDLARYDSELRPALTRAAMAELQDAGIEPDVWKLEGIDRRDDCAMVAEQARTGGRDRVSCVILGRGADTARAEHWLRTCAGVPGFVGFAIGRTIWGPPLQAHLDGIATRDATVAAIAARYRRAVAVATGAG